MVTSILAETPCRPEQVSWHAATWFDRIVVPANASTDGTLEMPLRLHEMGVIRCHETKVPPGQKPHPQALEIANGCEEGRSSHFVMVLDADAFPVVKQAPHHVG
ncbi:glycosyltransferase family 2 protein [Paracoccus spongiarum]|uniref:Glycosyltransferase family 2 protein n=1 Tax=Paracoccus spongiarum TaxID=3064387 RepID=A0ABT9JF94_9RHOB|nr:glycosyltransferase family 2 protein [Paracoccus sp. 2205BS29-5]MDP5307741.1 glycosyltransferase family 2 protein [Paracoccus sp. 2205BS29-5]